MSRAVLAALALALGLAAAPALAADCDTIADGVLFCPADTAWDGVPGSLNEGLGVTQYGRDQVLLLVGPVPDFIAEGWDGSAAGLAAVVESFATRTDAPVLDRPSLLGPDIAAASMVYQINPELVSLITVEDFAGQLVLVQTASEGTALSDHQTRLHQAALSALVEDGL